MIDMDRQTAGNHNRRMANESRFIDRRERLEAKIEHNNMIGELCREGRTVYYFFPVGGKCKESAIWTELADYIIAKGYVR